MSKVIRSRWKQLTKKVVSEPFVPILFTGEATKVTAVNTILEWVVGRDGPSEARNGIMLVLAATSIILWLYTTDDVAWGLHEAADAVDDAADN